MTEFIEFMRQVEELYRIPLNIWGFKFSIFSIIMFEIIAFIVVMVIRRLIFEDD